MNEARPPALDRDAAAALIESLTDIVIRASAAEEFAVGPGRKKGHGHVHVPGGQELRGVVGVSGRHR